MDGANLTATASTLASLLALLFLLAGAAWLARRLRGRLPGRGQDGAIAIIASRALGGGHVLVIAEAEGKRFLIGVSRAQMSVLGRLGAHD
ncbi:MAG TPA: flagellar biosynthetic protein FliO [Acidocella sp.]|jgi:flagellar protein FliO/FliZ|nr:flagellar biosynthetic protein FliO [Acidocella sp.]